MINKEQLIEFFDKYDSTFTLETGEQIQAIYFYDLGKVAEDLVKLLNIHSVMQAEASDGAEGQNVRCGMCGELETLVRPGKYQCDNEQCLTNLA
jgi:hypothetical protein